MIYQFDFWFAEMANRLLHLTNGTLTPIFRFATWLANAGIVFIVIATFLLLFRRTRKAGLVALASMFFGFLVTNVILKPAVARPRPFLDETSPFYSFWLEAGSLPESGYSFPSGHSTVSCAFAVSLFLCGKKRISWLSFLIPLLIGFTRIYFDVHYASDVLMGFVVGSICGGLGYLTLFLFRKIKFVDGMIQYDIWSRFFHRKKETD